MLQTRVRQIRKVKVVQQILGKILLKEIYVGHIVHVEDASVWGKLLFNGIAKNLGLAFGECTTPDGELRGW